MQRASVRCFKQGLYWRLIDRGGWNTRFWEKEKKRFDVISSIDVMETQPGRAVFRKEG